MALIRCPECGAEVSDKAEACPKCAYPFAKFVTKGIARIKMGVIKSGEGQKATVTDVKGNVLWTGRTGQIAEIPIDRPTQITIKYNMSLMSWGSKCTGTLDPAKGLKYAVTAKRDFFGGTELALQRVDVIDAD